MVKMTQNAVYKNYFSVHTNPNLQVLLKSFVMQKNDLDKAQDLMTAIRDFSENIKQLNKIMMSPNLNGLAEIVKTFENTYVNEGFKLSVKATKLKDAVAGVSKKEKKELKQSLINQKNNFSEFFVNTVKELDGISNEEKIALQGLAYDVKETPYYSNFEDYYKAVFQDEHDDHISQDAIKVFATGKGFVDSFKLMWAVMEDEKVLDDYVVTNKIENSTKASGLQSKKSNVIQFTNISVEAEASISQRIADNMMLLGQDLMEARDMMKPETLKNITSFEMFLDVKNYTDADHVSDALIMVNRLTEHCKIIKSYNEKATKTDLKNADEILRKKEKDAYVFVDKAKDAAAKIASLVGDNKYTHIEVNPLTRFIPDTKIVFNTLRKYPLSEDVLACKNKASDIKRAAVIEFSSLER